MGCGGDQAAKPEKRKKNNAKGVGSAATGAPVPDDHDQVKRKGSGHRHKEDEVASELSNSGESVESLSGEVSIDSDDS